MYEDLVKQLRNCTSDTVEDCAGCPYQGGFKGTYCMNGLISEAADAIEKLIEDKAALNRTIANLLEQLKDLGKPIWIPVTERLPAATLGDVSERVLVTDGEYVAIVEWFNFGECGSFWGYTGFGKDVTHWMPLPQPPTECRQMVTDSNQLIGDSEQLGEPVNNPYKLEE